MRRSARSKLSEDALEALIEDFMTREGTDDGSVERSLIARIGPKRARVVGRAHRARAAYAIGARRSVKRIRNL